LGIYLALDLVIALPLLPPAVAGQLLGFFTTARKVSQSLIPAIGPWLLAWGSGDLTGVDRSQNYFGLLVFGAVLSLVAMGLTTRLRLPDQPGATHVRQAASK
jgi:hypothetical protein